MESQEKYSGFKLEVLSKLKRRNDNERKRYEDVINLTNSLYELLDLHLKENVRLRISKANLEQDVIDLQGNPNASLPRPPVERTSSSSKNMLLLQDELTELLKQKAEYAQQVISLRSALEEKEKECTAKTSDIQELEAQLHTTEQLLKQVQQKLKETEHNLQFVKDEYDALLITYTSVEEKKTKLEKENQELIARYIELKALDADKMNAETESFQRKKQAKLQKELEEAAKEPVYIESNRSSMEFWPERLKLKNAKELKAFICRRSQICLDAIVPRRVQYKFDAHDGEVNAVAWTHTDFKFATAGGDHKVKIWDIVSGQPCVKDIAPDSRSSVFSIDFDPEESLVLAASNDSASRIWGINDMKIKHTLTGHTNKVMSAKFLGDASKVVSGSHDRTLKIWDLRKRACIRTILAVSSVNDLVTTDTTIVSGHVDRKVRFWDTRSESSKNEILLPGRITGLDLSVDGYSLLACVRDDTLKLIDFRMNTVTKTLSADNFLIGCDWTRAKFSPDGQYCICGSQDGCIYIWKVTTGSVEKVLREHNATVISCAWSWCGTYLLSCDKNKKAILWSEF